MSVVVVIFLIYPSLITISFGLFNCYELDPGQMWLLKDLQIKCWGSDHRRWALIIGIPMLLFWVVGIPFTALLILIRRRHMLFEEETLARYKMIYQGLRQRVFYWEFINLLRKLSVIVINVFFSTFDANYKVRKSIDKSGTLRSIYPCGVPIDLSEGSAIQKESLQRH